MRELEAKAEEDKRASIDRAGGPPPNQPTSLQDPVALGLRALDLTNDFRRSQKLPPLKWNQALHNVGLVHSKGTMARGLASLALTRRYAASIDMGQGRVPFSHDGFDKRMAAVPFRVRTFAENVAWNAGCSEPEKAAVNGWIKSPGHRKNMLGNFEYCGIAVYRNARGAVYFTQLFASAA